MSLNISYNATTNDTNEELAKRWKMRDSQQPQGRRSRSLPCCDQRKEDLKTSLKRRVTISNSSVLGEQLPVFKRGQAIAGNRKIAAMFSSLLINGTFHFHHK